MVSSSAGNATASLAGGLMDRGSRESRDVNGGALRGHLPNVARRGTRLSRGLRIHQSLEKHLQELGCGGCQPLVIPPTPPLRWQSRWSPSVVLGQAELLEMG